MNFQNFDVFHINFCPVGVMSVIFPIVLLNFGSLTAQTYVLNKHTCCCPKKQHFIFQIKGKDQK